jgi:hypothetical protein
MLSNQGNSTSWCSRQWASTTNYGIFTFSSNISRTWGKKGTISNFNRSIFDTLVVIPTMEVERTTRWTKHHTCSTCWWNNLNNIEVALLYHLAPVVGYYTFELVHVFNPNVANLELRCNQLLNYIEQLCNLEPFTSILFSITCKTSGHSRNTCWSINKTYYSRCLVKCTCYMGIVKQPFVQWNILVTTPQPIVDITLTCAYCQHVRHEFKNCPFVDDKLKWLMRKKIIISLPFVVMSTPTI